MELSWKQYCQVLLLCIFLHSSVLAQSDIDADELADLSLDELMNIEIESSALLTTTTRRMNPSAMTTITREEIAFSGARSLNEVTIDALLRAMGLVGEPLRQREVADLCGTWASDPETKAALDDQRRIDPEDWR